MKMSALCEKKQGKEEKQGKEKKQGREKKRGKEKRKLQITSRSLRQTETEKRLFSFDVISPHFRTNNRANSSDIGHVFRLVQPSAGQ
jgi:hypothetical protein